MLRFMLDMFRLSPKEIVPIVHPASFVSSYASLNLDQKYISKDNFASTNLDQKYILISIPVLCGLGGSGIKWWPHKLNRTY